MLRAISHLRSQLLTRTIPQILPHPTLPLTPTTPHPHQPQLISSYYRCHRQQLLPQSSACFATYWTRPCLQRHQGNDSNEEAYRDPTGPPRLFVVQPRLRPEPMLRAKLSEALNLANSLEQQRDGYYDTEFLEKSTPPHAVVQNPAARSTRADTYFGPGTVDMVKCHINALESEGGVDAIFVNAILTGVQQRNLERAWKTPVLDRVGLIIEIFNAHAQTKEAKLQAELAALMYKKTRLVRVRGLDGRYAFGTMGEAEVVSARGRGSGGRGFISGAGETELQLQRRRILDRRNQLLSEIKEVRRTRAVQRAARKRHQHGGMATVAIVGYTNAGKSSLVSALSDTFLYCDDRLFATVDPKLRSVDLPSGRRVLLSDTVGFISDLPVQLVEAFHATLEEVVEADLLVHVLDSSAPDLVQQRESVLQVLEQLGVSDNKLQNMIEVWNKIDLQDEEFGGVEHGEEDEDGGGVSGDEDEDGSGVSGEGDDNGETSGSLEEVLDTESGGCSDGWLSGGDELDSWVDHDGSSVGQEIPDNKQRDGTTDWKPFNRLPWKTTMKDTASHTSESVPHVKTSAITRVGLQELLELIDEKLKREEEPKRSIFERKWRPPQAEDTGIAVER